MGEQSKIQWTQNTWNPWHGCKKVSAGCKFCYMYRTKERFQQDATVVLRSKSGFYDPLKWKEPRLIFTCSWSDFFIEEADQWRDEAWKIIKQTPHHTYQILTKRPERFAQCLPPDWGAGYPNVWLGVSVEDQSNTTRILRLISTAAKIRFVSCEPLLGPLDLTKIEHKKLPQPDDLRSVFSNRVQVDALRGEMIHGQIGYHIPKLDWVIVGGESGNETGKYRYRDCKLIWITSIVEQCKAQKVPIFVKQLGTKLAKTMNLSDRHGGNPNEWPKHLQILQFPANVA